MISSSQEKKLEAEAKMREIYDARVYVIGGGFQYCKMFYDAGFRGARSVEDADLICFTGGEDVDPSLYGEKPIQGTHYNTSRDMFESVLYGEALALKKPMVGICRGAQFLNVMNGGGLWQDVNNHVGRKHSVTDTRTGKEVMNMTSTHHQQMIAGEGGNVIALASLSTQKKSFGKELERIQPSLDDVEVLWYDGTNSLCFQPHPEFQHGECRDYFLSLLDDFLMPAI